MGIMVARHLAKGATYQPAPTHYYRGSLPVVRLVRKRFPVKESCTVKLEIVVLFRSWKRSDVFVVFLKGVL